VNRVPYGWAATPGSTVMFITAGSERSRGMRVPVTSGG
jgi:hypothetical protein